MIHPLATKFHPVQNHDIQNHLPESVVLKAYEVYSHAWGAQPAMVDLEKGCRGGFSVNEIIAFLYAHSFPKDEWRQRIEEALERKPR
jgi:hypothetical protein